MLHIRADNDSTFQAYTVSLGFCAHLNFGETFLASQLIVCRYITAPRRQRDCKCYHPSDCENGLKKGGYWDALYFRPITANLFAKMQLN